MRNLGQSLFAKMVSLLLIACLMAGSMSLPASARYISPDNLDPTIPGVGTNRYAYSENDPINKSDPNGHIWGAVIGGLIRAAPAIIGAIAGWFSSSTPANAPGPDDSVEPSNEDQAMINMAAGACVGGGCSGAIKGGLTALSKMKKEEKKEVSSTEQRNAKAEAGVNTEGGDFARRYKSAGDEYSVTAKRQIHGDNVSLSDFTVNKIGDGLTNPTATNTIKNELKSQFKAEGFNLTAS